MKAPLSKGMVTFHQTKLFILVFTLTLAVPVHLSAQDWKNAYDKVFPMNHTYSVVRKNNKSGVVETKTGKQILPVEYNMVDNITDTIFIVEQKYRGYISHTGKWIIPMKYNYIWFEAPDRGIVEINGKYGVVDFQGRIIIETKYYRLDRASKGCFVAEDDNGWGVIDRDGKILIPLNYDEVHTNKRGLFSAKQGNKWGLIDWEDRIIIPFQYDYIYPFSEDLAQVNTHDKDGKNLIGYINRENQFVIDYQRYDLADDFEGGRARVFLNKEIGYIDKTGKIVVPLK